MPIGNIPSVMEHGILSYERAAQLDHHSVAMPEIQDRRDRKQVPGGLRLHQYANLYFHARNPMMYKRRHEIHTLCVLRVSTEVIAEQGTVLADQNASSGYVRFLHPSQWNFLRFDDIYAMDWRHPDPIEGYRRKSRKCAEVLVPHRVNVARLLGAYVVDEETAGRLAATAFALPVTINSELFFQ